MKLNKNLQSSNIKLNEDMSKSAFIDELIVMLRTNPKFSGSFNYIWNYKFIHLSPYSTRAASAKKFSALDLKEVLTDVIDSPRSFSGHRDAIFAGVLEISQANLEKAAQYSLNCLLVPIILDKWIARFKDTDFGDIAGMKPFKIIVPKAGNNGVGVDNMLIQTRVRLTSCAKGHKKQPVHSCITVFIDNVLDSRSVEIPTSSLINNLIVVVTSKIGVLGQPKDSLCYDYADEINSRLKNVVSRTPIADLAKKVNEIATLSNVTLKDLIDDDIKFA